MALTADPRPALRRPQAGRRSTNRCRSAEDGENREILACGQAEPVIRDLLTGHGTSRSTTSTRYAGELGLDGARLGDFIKKRAGAARIAEDVAADLSGASGAPTFFINGRRHYGSYDITALTAAVVAAKATAATTHRNRTPRTAGGSRREGERAAVYLIDAADRASRGWAKGEAVALYRQALTLVGEDDPQRRRELRLKLAVALQMLYHVSDAEDGARQRGESSAGP